MKKTILAVAAILAFAAICITLIICGEPGYALGAIGIVALAFVIVAYLKIFF